MLDKRVLTVPSISSFPSLTKTPPNIASSTTLVKVTFLLYFFERFFSKSFISSSLNATAVIAVPSKTLFLSFNKFLYESLIFSIVDILSLSYL